MFVEVIKAVTELNETSFDEVSQFYEPMFTYSIDGFAERVNFLGVTIWASYDDCRDFNEDKNEYEPFIDCLKREASRRVKNLKQSNFFKGC